MKNNTEISKGSIIKYTGGKAIVLDINRNKLTIAKPQYRPYHIVDITTGSYDVRTINKEKVTEKIGQIGIAGIIKEDELFNVARRTGLLEKFPIKHLSTS